MTRKPALAALIAAAVLLLPIGDATAKSPPKGKYVCFSEGGLSGGPAAIRIFKKGKYNVGGKHKKKGKFKTKGKKITWKTGSFRKVWRSKWRYSTSNKKYAIDLYAFSDKRYEQVLYKCYRSKHSS